MTPIRCIAIDDEPLALNVLEGYIRKIPGLEFIRRFTNSVEALEFLNSNEVDLLFVDIQMPDLTGMDLINRLNHKPVLIFTTAYSEFALQGFRADAIDYLLKPIDFPDFERAVHKAKDWIYTKRNQAPQIQSTKDFLFIKSEYKVIRLNFSEILYIQGMSEYVRIFMTTGKPVMSLISMKSLEAQLPDHRFMRVHKSFIVNLEKINVIERNEIVYPDGTIIPVSAQYKARFQEFVDNNFLI